MPAHIRFKAVDEKPVGFSSFWLQEVLRKQIGFNGAIISDDLGMVGAQNMGSYLERAEKALAAGCDMVIMSNQPMGVKEILSGLQPQITAESEQRLLRAYTAQGN